MVENLKIIEKTIVAIGALDISYIAWIVFNSLSIDQGQLSMLWDSLISFGLPLPELQFGAIIMFYASILICGFALVLRRKQFAWLNYAQFPIRLLLVVPTLYPVFLILAKSGVELSLVLSVALLGIIEVGRVAIVYRWRSHAA